MNFETGQIVVLKGSPKHKMVVESIQGAMGSNCCWIDQYGKRHTEYFDDKMLELFDDAVVVDPMTLVRFRACIDEVGKSGATKTADRLEQIMVELKKLNPPL